MHTETFSDANEILRTNVALRDVFQSRGTQLPDDYEWLLPSARTWLSEPCDSFLGIIAQPKAVSDVRSICVDLIQLLQENHKPVAWILQDRTATPRLVDLLNCLVAQVSVVTDVATNQGECADTKIAHKTTNAPTAADVHICQDTLSNLLGRTSKLFLVIDHDILRHALKGCMEEPSFWRSILASPDPDRSLKVVLVGTTSTHAGLYGIQSFEETVGTQVVTAEAPRALSQVPNHRPKPFWNLQPRGKVRLAELIRSVGNEVRAEGISKSSMVAKAAGSSSESISASTSKAPHFAVAKGPERSTVPKNPATDLELFDSQTPSTDA